MSNRPLGTRTARSWGALLPLVLLAAGGCAGRGTVSGHVRLNGKPVPLGTISFHCQEGRHEVCNALIRDGTYSIDGVPAGPTRVTVASAFTPGPGQGEGAAGKRPAAMPTGRAPSPPAVPPPPTIPSHYGDPDQSGLSLRVHAGAQVYDVDVPP
jgi:hypothetical protein